MGGQSGANMDAYSNMAQMGTPQLGPLMGYKPNSPNPNSEFDLKGPLAQMALGIAMNQMATPQRQAFNPMQPMPVYGQRQPVQMGRLYGGY